MFGNVLVTKQTGEEGKQVNRLLITSAQEIKSEYYVAVLLDREFDDDSTEEASLAPASLPADGVDLKSLLQEASKQQH